MSQAPAKEVAMQDGVTEFAGIVIHSDDPLFLTIVALHFMAGLFAVTAGVVAMLSRKQRGGHSRWGAAYFWSICAVFTSAAALTFLRGPEDLHLLLLGASALATAWIGCSARRGRWRNSTRVHLAAMGCSYIFLLTAFYVETGDQLPLWRSLPPILYWILPAALGLPIIAYALMRRSSARPGVGTAEGELGSNPAVRKRR